MGLRPATVALFAALTVASGVSAQDAAPTLIPDRPGLGDGAHVVGAGVVQLEAGADWAFGDGEGTVSLGQGLVRVGLGPIELRVLPGSTLFEGGDVGLTDATLGAKIPLVRGDARLSAVVATTLPTGSDRFGGGPTTGAVTLVGEVGLTPALGLAVNGGYAFPFESAEGDGSWTLIVTPALALPGVEGLSVYWGWAGFFSAEDTHIAEAGLAWAPHSDWQLDVNAGSDVETGRTFVGIGVAHRWR